MPQLSRKVKQPLSSAKEKEGGLQPFIFPEPGTSRGLTREPPISPQKIGHASSSKNFQKTVHHHHQSREFAPPPLPTPSSGETESLGKFKSPRKIQSNNSSSKKIGNDYDDYDDSDDTLSSKEFKHQKHQQHQPPQKIQPSHPSVPPIVPSKPQPTPAAPKKDVNNRNHHHNQNQSHPSLHLDLKSGGTDPSAEAPSHPQTGSLSNNAASTSSPPSSLTASQQRPSSASDTSGSLECEKPEFFSKMPDPNICVAHFRLYEQSWFIMTKWSHINSSRMNQTHSSTSVDSLESQSSTRSTANNSIKRKTTSSSTKTQINPSSPDSFSSEEELQNTNSSSSTEDKKTKQKNKLLSTLGFELVITDGKRVWTGQCADKEIERLTPRGMEPREYIKCVRTALTKQDHSELEFKYGFEQDSQKSPTFVWKFYVGRHPEGFWTKASVLLERIRSEKITQQIMSQFIELAINNSTYFQSRVENLEFDNLRLNSLKDEAIRHFSESTKEKEEMERDMYQKFVWVINEKKTKIQELCTQLETKENQIKELESRVKQKEQQLLKKSKVEFATPAKNPLQSKPNLETQQTDQTTYPSQSLEVSDSFLCEGGNNSLEGLFDESNEFNFETTIRKRKVLPKLPAEELQSASLASPEPVNIFAENGKVRKEVGGIGKKTSFLMGPKFVNHAKELEILPPSIDVDKKSDSSLQIRHVPVRRQTKQPSAEDLFHELK